MVIYINHEKVVEFDNSDNLTPEEIQQTLSKANYNVNNAKYRLSEDGTRLDFFVSAKKLG